MKDRFEYGGYGYMGEYTDISNANAEPMERLEAYKEYALALDFLIELFGVRLQAEHVRNLKRMDPDLPRPFAQYIIDQANGERYVGGLPDFLTTKTYGLLAYTLPLSEWLGNFTITPYVLAMYDAPEYYIEHYNVMVGFGINLKPSTYVSIKLEATRYYSFYEGVFGPDGFVTWPIQAQLAVAF